MGQFTISIVAVGPNSGCDRVAQAGDKLFERCGRLNCADCLAYDFVQQLRQKGNVIGIATITHWAGTKHEIVDDLVKNERRSGSF